MLLPYTILKTLSDGCFHSGEALAKAAGVTRAAVWKAIQTLQASYALDIHSVRGRGYRLTDFLAQSIYEVRHPVSPSIAVLPFSNIGNQAEQDCFCDGLAVPASAILSEFTCRQSNRGLHNSLSPYRVAGIIGICKSISWCAAAAMSLPP